MRTFHEVGIHKGLVSLEVKCYPNFRKIYNCSAEYYWATLFCLMGKTKSIVKNVQKKVTPQSKIRRLLSILQSHQSSLLITIGDLLKYLLLHHPPSYLKFLYWDRNLFWN